MIYACVHPDKFEGDKASKIMQVEEISNFMCIDGFFLL